MNDEEVDNDFNKNYEALNCLLISVDNKKYYLNYLSLISNSSFWLDLFNLPQPADGEDDSENGSDNYVNCKRVVHMQEHSSSLKPLLLILTSRPPRITNVEQLQALIELSLKYDCFYALSYLQSQLLHLSFSDPLRSYSLAARYGWNDLAVRISTLTLDFDINSLSEYEIDLMPTHFYRRLINLHNNRLSMAKKILNNQDLLLSNKHEGEYDRLAHLDWWSSIKQNMLNKLDNYSASNRVFKFPQTLPFLDCVKSKAYVDGDKDVLSFRGLYLINRTIEMVEHNWNTKLPKSI